MSTATVATDTFARASLGANWAQTSGSLTLGIISSTALGVTAGSAGQDGAIRWAGAGSFGTNQFSQITLSNTGSSTTVAIIGPAVFVSSVANTYYWAAIFGGSVFIQKVVAGSPTNFVSYSYSPVVGDVHRLEGETIGGNTILRLYLNGVVKAAWVDASSALTTGVPGIGGFGFGAVTSMQATPWSGGTNAITFTTQFTDNFTRANENPLTDGGQWTSMNEAVNNPMQLLGNLAEGTVVSARNTSLVTGTNFPRDQWASATIGTIAGAGIPYVVCRASGTGATNQCYRLDSNAGTYRLIKETNSSLPNLLTVSGSFANGDVMLLSVIGPLLTGYKNGIPVIAYADNSGSSFSSGQPGLGTNPGTPLTNVTFTNFSAGDFGTSLLLQSGLNALSTTTTRTFTFPKNVSAGNLLIVGICDYNAAFTGTTISDTQGNSYTVLPVTQGTSGGMQLAYAIAKSTGANTITTTVAPSSTNNQAVFAEYKIPGPFDVKNTGVASTAAFTSNTTATTTFTQELLIGIYFQRNIPLLTTADPNWNMRSGQANAANNYNIQLWDQVVNGKAAYTFSGVAASTGSQWVAGIFTFNLQVLNVNLLMMMGAGT